VRRRASWLTFSGGCGGGRGGATWDSGDRGDAAPASSIAYGQDPTSGVGDARKGKMIVSHVRAATSLYYPWNCTVVLFPNGSDPSDVIVMYGLFLG